MASGAASIDVLLLVVAADDAVMPQTVEHMKIAKLLGVQQVMTAISKIDLVDKDLVELVREDVREFLVRSGYPEAPVVPMSNETGEGIEEVKMTLAGLVQAVSQPEDSRTFRMYVRHVFTVKGRGTVVTGVPLSGKLTKDDALELLPSRKKTSVRGIQNYRSDSDATEAHISSAVNLRDLAANELDRGMALCAPGAYRPTDAVVVRFTNTTESYEVPRRSEVRILVGTAKAVARMFVIDRDVIPPGEIGFARLRFADPVVLSAGDRFIVRAFSPAETLGGGIVLSNRIGRIRRSSPGLAERLAQANAAAEALRSLESELLAGAREIVTAEELSYLSQRSKAEARARADSLVAEGMLQPLGSDAWLVLQRRPELLALIKRALGRYHRAHPYSVGMKPSYAIETAGLAASAFDDLAAILTDDSDIVLRHGSLALKEFKPQISAREAKLRDEVLAEVEAAGIQTIAKGDIQQKLSMTPSELKVVSKLLIAENLISVVGGNLVSQEVVEDVRRQLIELFEENEVVELKQFREKTGLSRNFGVALLEHFDSTGMTKRRDKGRVLLQTSRRSG